METFGLFQYGARLPVSTARSPDLASPCKDDCQNHVARKLTTRTRCHSIQLSAPMDTSYDASALFVAATLPRTLTLTALTPFKYMKHLRNCFPPPSSSQEPSSALQCSHERATNGRGLLIEKLLNDRVCKSNPGRPRLLF